jgi:hydrogenase maturation protein HypF
MWRAALAERDPAMLAARFHAGLAEATAALARDLAAAHGARAVALTGGCFQNVTLLEAVAARLSDLRLLIPAAVPPNDGGLALGQAAVAACRMLSSR